MATKAKPAKQPTLGERLGNRRSTMSGYYKPRGGMGKTFIQRLKGGAE